VGVITNSWTIAQIHGRVAKLRHFSKIAAGCQKSRKSRLPRFREFLLTLFIIHVVISPKYIVRDWIWPCELLLKRCK